MQKLDGREDFRKLMHFYVVNHCVIDRLVIILKACLNALPFDEHVDIERRLIPKWIYIPSSGFPRIHRNRFIIISRASDPLTGEAEPLPI